MSRMLDLHIGATLTTQILHERLLRSPLAPRTELQPQRMAAAGKA